MIWEAVTWAHWLPIEGHLFSSLLSYLLKKLPLLSWLRLLSWLGLVHLAQGRDTPEKPLTNQAWVSLPEEGETKTNQPEKEMLPKDTTWVPEESFEEDPDDGWIPAFGTGFTKVPGGDEWKRKSVLSWHYYYPPLTYSTKSFPWWHRALAHWLFGPGVFLRSEKEARKLGAASLLTEWGIARPDADKPDSWGSVEAAWVMERADLHSLSWCYLADHPDMSFFHCMFQPGATGTQRISAFSGIPRGSRSILPSNIFPVHSQSLLLDPTSISPLTQKTPISKQAGRLMRRRLRRRMLPPASSFFQNMSLVEDWRSG